MTELDKLLIDFINTQEPTFKVKYGNWYNRRILIESDELRLRFSCYYGDGTEPESIILEGYSLSSYFFRKQFKMYNLELDVSVLVAIDNYITRISNAKYDKWQRVLDKKRSDNLSNLTEILKARQAKKER